MIGAIFDKVYPDGDPTTHIRAILHSVSGVADIVNHERTSWSNQAKQVTDKQVKAQR